MRAQATPRVSSCLFTPAAAMMPATWVPCPLSSPAAPWTCPPRPWCRRSPRRSVPKPAPYLNREVHADDDAAAQFRNLRHT